MIEFWGCIAFALPYVGIVAWFGLGFVASSYLTGEGSEAVIRLSQRWIIKALFVLGLWLLLAAIVAVLLRFVVFLFGDPIGAEARLNIERTPDPT